jgi:nucleoside 2-deoxyribosyltransferase
MVTVVICCSANFYEHANKLADELRAKGFNVVVPKTAVKMQTKGDYDVDKEKTWYRNPDDFDIKAERMHAHFDAVAAGDAILVINDEKHEVKGYIGPNTLMEMGLAFHLRKPIYVLNSIDKDMPVYEEVVGMNSVILDGDITKISLEKE